MLGRFHQCIFRDDLSALSYQMGLFTKMMVYLFQKPFRWYDDVLENTFHNPASK